ncbi:YceI family protein [Xanthomarina sp. F2636L]|uniref:YceI family protein n=1 Tax=Xanthomarina sp. F2636L TaxID=2996018 RepID=UPI00225E1305|nr:YceI family protein [Xanthomarina sp. F2636L]MCX7550677.1 YceI family protein [Xanthomarina sp. F2636L]
MKTIYSIILFIATLGFTFFQSQTIDNNASEVSFKISNLGLNTVKGTFKNMSGTFNFNSADLENSNFDICIDAGTIDTGNKKRDTHLRSEDFFEVETYPTICFESTSIIKQEGKYLTKGNLTIHGVTKIVEIPFEFTNNTFSGDFELERLDYNIGEDTGTFMVGSTAKITITCVVKS